MHMLPVRRGTHTVKISISVPPWQSLQHLQRNGWPRTSLLVNETATSAPRTSFPVLDNEPKFTNVWTVLATECWLRHAVNCWGTCQSPRKLWRFSSRQLKDNGEVNCPSLPCRFFQTHTPWSRDRWSLCRSSFSWTENGSACAHCWRRCRSLAQPVSGVGSARWPDGPLLPFPWRGRAWVWSDSSQRRWRRCPRWRCRTEGRKAWNTQQWHGVRMKCF